MQSYPSFFLQEEEETLCIVEVNETTTGIMFIFWKAKGIIFATFCLFVFYMFLLTTMWN